MKKVNPGKHVWYSPELDEIFRLNIKPKHPKKVHRLFVEKTKLLDYIIYLGEL